MTLFNLSRFEFVCLRVHQDDTDEFFPRLRRDGEKSYSVGAVRQGRKRNGDAH